MKLPDSRRGGVLTHGQHADGHLEPDADLAGEARQVDPGEHPRHAAPAAAPDVPELPPTGELKGTLRQQMEQHRANPSCAVCHAKLDPLGFGLENFDAIGGWRTQDNKQDDRRVAACCPDGEKFNGPAELRKVLLGKADQFRRCLAEKLLTFALGRGLEYYDKCAVDDIVTAAKADGRPVLRAGARRREVRPVPEAEGQAERIAP